MTCRITGLKKPSEISEKGLDLFFNYFYILLHVYTCMNCSTTGGGGGGGGRVMEVK